MTYQERIKSLTERQNESGFVAVALIPGPSLFYFTGLSFHLMERPVILLLLANGDHRMVLPGLERAKLEASGLGFKSFAYGEEEGASLEAMKLAVDGAELNGSRLGVEPLRMRFFEQSMLQQTLQDVDIRPADRVISALRMSKDDAEIANMQRAAEIAEAALKATLPQIRSGMTELELASELSMQVLRSGSEPETPFSPIVASGPNSAVGHHTPSERALAPGDSLVLDWGATYRGYMSDITRSFFIEEVPDEFDRIHGVVKRANAVGREAIKPGVACESIDRATRSEIVEAGYGEWFHHRTGHGLGLEAHEPPFIREGEATLLEVGMTFTVEPGIYIPGRGGIRIEDDIVVTDEGSLTLTSYSRDLEVIG